MNSQAIIKRNSIIYMIRNIANILFPLITFKYVSIIIKASGIGAANYSSAIVGYFSLIAQLGINTYAIAEGSKLRHDKKKLEEFASKIFTINIISTIIAYILLFIFLQLVEGILEYRYLIIIYSISIFCSTIGTEWIFVIHEKFKYITIRAIVIQIISLLLLFVLVKNENDVIWYVTLSAISSSGSGILNYFYTKKLVKINIRPFHECKQYIKPIILLWIANVASLIYVNADTIIIGYILGDKEVGVYSAAVKIVKAICVPIASISAVAAPQIADQINRQNKKEITRLVSGVFDFMSFFWFPCIIGLWLLSEEAILLLSGEEFLVASTVERILIIDIILSPLNGFIVNQLLVPAKKERQLTIIMLLAAFANIVLDIILIPTIGIEGAAIATVISELVVTASGVTQIKKIINISDVFKNTWKFLAASSSIVLVHCFLKIWTMHWMLNTIALVVFGGGIYLGALWLMNGRKIKFIKRG